LRPISLGAFFYLFFTDVHLTLGEDLFTAYCLSVPAYTQFVVVQQGQRLGSVASFFLCTEASLAADSRVSARGGNGADGFRLINSSISN
jgi:hypothetical protein